MTDKIAITAKLNNGEFKPFHGDPTEFHAFVESIGRWHNVSSYTVEPFLPEQLIIYFMMDGVQHSITCTSSTATFFCNAALDCNGPFALTWTWPIAD